MCATLSSHAAEKLSRAACVRWKDPGDELLGLARVAHALIDRGELCAADVCFAVPNRNWAYQMKRACQAAKLSSTVCIAPARLSRQAEEALFMLDAIADRSPEALRALEAFGHVPGDVESIARKCAPLHGFTLVKVLGIDKVADFAHALYHLSGTETAGELASVLRNRTAHPAIPPHVDVAPIVDARSVAASGAFARVFLVGCVDGLVPGPAALEARDDADRAAALDADRLGFEGALLASRGRAVVSYFEKVDVGIAQAAHIRFTRKKTEHGRAMAMCAPSAFLAEAGALRPATVGGQTFLREFNLN